ncbi:hypothetical protein [uncultured Ruegeria sp.]|uniref:hypothetical protein n=1 Tax=uncultured Ruegeria sp. TaxID=259304 RepID=UPI00262FCF2C|nr:hypothetical protein [uncultured Ruegeria sp.]
MKILVAIAMLTVILASGFEALILAFDTMIGNYEELWWFLSIEVSPEHKPGYIAWPTALVGLATWLCIILAFWPLHQLIWSKKELSFQFVGSRLKRSAYGCLGFWLGSTILFTVIPLIVIWGWDATVIDDTVLVPIGFETVFLIISLIFVTVGRTLERAEVIEDEINHIL